MRRNPEPVESEADIPPFCGGCGRSLDKRVMDRFDRWTGRLAVGPVGAYCPRWDDSRVDNHDAYIVSPRPEPFGTLVPR